MPERVARAVAALERIAAAVERVVPSSTVSARDELESEIGKALHAVETGNAVKAIAHLRRARQLLREDAMLSRDGGS